MLFVTETAESWNLSKTGKERLKWTMQTQQNTSSHFHPYLKSPISSNLRFSKESDFIIIFWDVGHGCKQSAHFNPKPDSSWLGLPSLIQGNYYCTTQGRSNSFPLLGLSDIVHSSVGFSLRNSTNDSATSRAAELTKQGYSSINFSDFLYKIWLSYIHTVWRSQSS